MSVLLEMEPVFIQFRLYVTVALVTCADATAAFCFCLIMGETFQKGGSVVQLDQAAFQPLGPRLQVFAHETQ